LRVSDCRRGRRAPSAERRAQQQRGRRRHPPVEDGLAEPLDVLGAVLEAHTAPDDRRRDAGRGDGVLELALAVAVGDDRLDEGAVEPVHDQREERRRRDHALAERHQLAALPHLHVAPGDAIRRTRSARLGTLGNTPNASRRPDAGQ